MAAALHTLYDEFRASLFDHGPDKIVVREPLYILLPGQGIEVSILAVCEVNYAKESEEQDTSLETDKAIGIAIVHCVGRSNGKEKSKLYFSCEEGTIYYFLFRSYPFYYSLDNSEYGIFVFAPSTYFKTLS